jgi:hypothetical protein
MHDMDRTADHVGGAFLALGSLEHGSSVACRTQGCEMGDKADLAKRYRRRAEDVQTIAKGLYDETERTKLMEVVDDYEQWAIVMESPGSVNLRHLRLVISH